jgi:branched-chain amino acid aminotransferase
MSESVFQRMANVDGLITPAEEAKISIFDRGFLYGDSVYEVFRTYSGVGLFFDEHFDRLENSAQLIHMPMTQSRSELVEEIRLTIRATGIQDPSQGAFGGQDVYVRYHITRGTGPVDLNPDPKLKTSYVVIVKEVPTWKAEYYSHGMRLAVPHVRRNPIGALNPNIKGGNYLNNILALAEAVNLGADDCAILNHDGLVTEASNSNLFFVIDGQLATPGDGAGNLRGITKTAIRKACGEHGLEVEEKDLHASDLPRTSECFVTSATRGVMPVISLRLEDGKVVEFPAGGGELTRLTARYYRQYVDRYVQQHAEDRLV